ncbi:DUF4133 domain-containing protein [Adhaeribacter rhizoryzae]|uniref:DUF4133 domain-containing protein n=1 Tax=Adhaeribacter rhizoryzae TaxID=2607907 RepID=A0A5M6D3E2_9BACT|nr:DUF4133 domain-containing protein [Adhaeribacter rhizoryzae]KAA5541994.1 DUF4133 domain-containing protein [Adhaeribacter rhizoryzae]
MANYGINKGINKPVEFKGLKAQYLMYFFVGLLGVFMSFTILYLIGLHLYTCFLLAFVATSLLFHFVFKWNRVYGEHGLMKKEAARKRPNYLVNQGKFLRMLQYKRKR